ncbi:MAG TPA: carboxypeptidase-like regulatory domain-containing protein [Bryobacteraceae bacterium]|nr:carboxypeptidase-like regulatory domain-containing protein [Bryobacteraceae bacterium]
MRPPGDASTRMWLKTHNSVAWLFAGLLWVAPAPPARGAVAPPMAGVIAGLVTDTAGIPQMGATVLLYNRQDRLYEKGLTNERGEFTFAGLAPDLYSIRVTLASFVPAVKSRILVQPGIRSFFSVSLATLFSSIQLVRPGSAEQPAVMTDEWKWVLRTASSTRPVLRLLPGRRPDLGQEEHTAIFSDTRGVVNLAAGGSGPEPGMGSSDLGTAFALATSLFGKNALQFSGNLGSGSQSGMPSAAFRTSFSRSNNPDGPQVAVTMRQLFLPGRLAEGLTAGNSSLPAMRSLSVSFDQHQRLTDNLSLQYGFAMDSVSFLERLNYFSPYARLTYDLGENGTVEFVYTSGNARPDLAVANSPAELDAQAGTELQRDLGALGMFPRVSMRDGRTQVQRGDDFEMTYSRKIGSRTYSLGAYHESVTNAALTVAAPQGLYGGTDLLPDLLSGYSVFNGGDYQTNGYTAAVTQFLGDHLSATLMYGSIGALTLSGQELASASPDDLRSMIRASRANTATARVTATSPWTGTHMIASYQWTDRPMASPGVLYSTQVMRPEPGLNLYFRQPIPGLSILPWRMEVTADLRNLLAQGYLPLSTANGRRVLLMQTPRAFRGGLSFIF